MTAPPDPHDALLRRCDAYLDAAPREHADVVDVGPLRAFVSRAPWPYYVRPRPEIDLSSAGSVTAHDVLRAAEVLDAHGQAVSFEWVADLVPALGEVLAGEGYSITTHPLLAYPLGPLGLVRPRDDDLRARVVPADDDAVAAALAVSDVGFAAPGTGIDAAGVPERDAATTDDAITSFVRGRIDAGTSVLAVLEAGPAGVVCSGWHQPVDGATEVVGVATLPAYRRRGYAALVVEALLDDAAARGISLALLSASDDAVARVYERVGFERVGHVGAAERPPVPRPGV